MQRKAMTILTWGTALMIVAEGDYPGYAATVTPAIFTCLFTSLISGVPSLFDLAGFALFAAIVLPAFGTAMGRNRWFKVMTVAAILFPLAVALSSLFGLAKGGQVRIVYWQTRGMLMLPIWSMVAYVACRSPADAIRYTRVFVAAVLVKTVQNIFVLWVGHGGHLKGEYLSTHIASLFMATAMLALALRFAYPTGERRKLWIPFAILMIAYIWIVNDRRTSTLGLTFSLLFSLPFVLPLATRRQVRRGFQAVAACAMVVGVSWFLPGPAGALGKAVRNMATHSGAAIPKTGDEYDDPTANYDYRDIENYDLSRAIGGAPLTGTGFGAAFEHYMELPDIFSLSETLSWIPHNNLLMIWMDAGPFGVAGLGVFLTFGIAALVRLFRATTSRQVRIFAFVGYSSLVQWLLYIWADMAFAWVPSLVVPAVMMGMGFRLLGDCSPRQAPP